MTEYRFYHLLRSTTFDALPPLLDKGFKGGRRMIVRVANDDTAEKLNTHLWVYHPDAFLPHGTAADGQGEHQPIWITCKTDNPNGATMLVLTAGAPTNDTDVQTYDLVCDMFDGRDDDALTAARARWSALKSAGSTTLAYWQQTDTGWEKKA